MSRWSIGTKITVSILSLFVLAVLLHIFVIRPWYLVWGATEAELVMPLPGDPYIPSGSEVTTRAITILAAPAKIWPWIAQLGQEHGGFYSYHWLENLFGADMHNADVVLPESERVQVGETISYLRDGPEVTKAEVSLIEPGKVLVLEGWSFYLEPVDEHTTRLIVRYPFPIEEPGLAAYYYGSFEPIHFIMESGMLMGIKRRSEAVR